MDKLRRLLFILGIKLLVLVNALAHLGKEFVLWLVSKGQKVLSWLWCKLKQFWRWFCQKYDLLTRLLMGAVLFSILFSIGLIVYIYKHSKIQPITSGPASHHDMEWVSETPLEEGRHVSIYQDRYRQVICYVLDTQMSCVNNIFALEEKRLEQRKIEKAELPKVLTPIQKSTDVVEMYNYTKDENEKFKPNPIFKEREKADTDYEKLDKPPGEASPAKKTAAWRKAYQRNR